MPKGKLIEFVNKKKKKQTPVASPALKKVIRKEIAGKSEIKQVDCTLTGTLTTTLTLATGGSTIMSDIQEGTSEIQRVGDQILVKSINLRGNISTDNQFDAEAYCYMALVLFKTTNKTLPDLTNVWTSLSNVGVSLRHPDFMEHYSVLKIVKIKLIPRFGAAAADQPLQNIDWNHRFKGQGMKVQYDGNGGSFTDVITNNIFVYIQYIGGPLTPPVLTNGILRINYTD